MRRLLASSWWALTMRGILGVCTFFLPAITLTVLALRPGITVVAPVHVLAAWAVLTGLVGFAAAIQLQEYINGKRLLALVIQPRAGAVVVAWRCPCDCRTCLTSYQRGLL